MSKAHRNVQSPPESVQGEPCLGLYLGDSPPRYRNIRVDDDGTVFVTASVATIGAITQVDQSRTYFFNSTSGLWEPWSGPGAPSVKVTGTGTGGASGTATLILPDNLEDTGNSSVTPLGASGTFTGTWRDNLAFAADYITVITNVNGTLIVDNSKDGITSDRTVGFSVTGGTPFAIATSPLNRYTRIIYNNGGTAQDSFRLQTLARVIAPAPTLLRMDGALGDSLIVATSRAVLAGKDPVTGTYANIAATPLNPLSSAVGLVNREAPFDTFEAQHITLVASTDTTITFASSVSLVRVLNWDTANRLLVKDGAITSDADAAATRVGFAPTASVPGSRTLPFQTTTLHLRSAGAGEVTVEGYR
jgi:hypothetical protein